MIRQKVVLSIQVASWALAFCLAPSVQAKEAGIALKPSMQIGAKSGAAPAQATAVVAAKQRLPAGVSIEPASMLATPKRWPSFDAKTTPLLDMSGYQTLLKSGRVLDSIIEEQSPAKSMLFLRVDTGAAWRLPVPTLDVPLFMQQLFAAKIRVGIVQDQAFASMANHMGDGFWMTLLASIPVGTIIGEIVFIVFLALVMVWVQMKGARMMTAQRIKAIKPRDIKVSFNDVAGIDEAVRDTREAVAFLAKPEHFARLGAKLPKGILLVGPPGGGKTMLAKAFAKECDAPFYAVSGSEFVEMFVGLGASRIRALFKKARKSKKAVIFIDEIDALAKKRGGMNSHSEAEQTLNQLLVEMDGIDPGKSQIIVIAATNRIDAMDEAVLRPGRFDRQIHVSEPSLKGREDILRVYLKAHMEDAGIDPAALAKMCVGFSGAQLANLVNEALIRAAREGRVALGQADLVAARDKILLGDPRKDLDMTDDERRNTAIHESGHAVVALVASKDPVEKVTIEPRSRALGLMLQVPERDAVSLKESEARARLLVFLGGRAAEEVFNGDVTTGASNDMERAFEMALRMVSQWGYGEALGKNGVNDLNKLSPGLREAVEREARDLVNTSYDGAIAIVQAHREAILAMADMLMECETIDRKSVLELWSRFTALA
ncbi:MAG: ATP-dependent metallopeptidase FtsH/Yme1/Tma family protein [Acidobacteriaceae bacterium]